MKRLKERAVSLLLAAVMLLGFFPPAMLTALAADESIKLTGCDFTGMSYHSEALGNASIHTIEFNYAGGMTGFCGDHGKKMSRTLIGQTWGHKTEITDPTVKMMMAYYYDHTLGKFTDAAIAKGVNNVWDDDYVYYMNAWIQAIIWLYRTGQLTNPVEDCAEELMWVFNCLKNENHTSIDECTAGSETSFRETTEYIFTLGAETWGLADVYAYEFTGAGNENYPPELIQSVVIGNVEHSSTPASYSLTVKKVDATNTSLGISGAGFHIVKQGSTESWDVTTGSGGTYTLSNLSAGTYAITETSAPDGYTIDNVGPDYVVLPNNGEASVTKVFTDTPTITVNGSIRKVDRDNPSKGLAGATIAIQGIDNSFYGEYQTGADGALEGLEWSSLTPGSYRAWEVSAPEGYSLDPSDVKTFRISAETREVRLVFKNDAKVKVRLIKLDASDNPLAGAIFNVFRDGRIIATEATDANGQIAISDVETGTYAFVETFAPEGYAVNDQPAIVHVSQADIEGGGVISVTAVDKKLPDLTIQKKDALTGESVPNTVFELRGIHTGYQKEVITGNDGTATLTGIPVDYYEVTEKNVPAPYTLSDERTQTVWLGAGEHPTLVFSNLQEPKLSIMKIDAETSTPIAGVVFSVQGIDVDYSADWTTGTDGKYSAQITPGSYRITEVSVPAPYVISANNVRTVALRAGSEQELVFENLKNPLLNLTKIDALDGRTIPGTVFSVQGVDNSYSGNWTTGADGTVSERIEPGTYRITEVSVPAPYYLPENAADRVQTISLQAGDIRSLVFKDYRTPTLTIYKLDSVSGAPIEGAQFHVTYTRVSDIPDAPATYDFGTLYSNADGEIPLHETGVKLYPGRYTVTETAPAPGFQMREPTTQSVTINGSESRSVTFYNAPLNAIIVEKYDAQTGRALPGATFRLRYLGGTSGSGGTVIGIKTTGVSGSAIWTGLEAGTYIVDEISAPEGYNILRSSETVYLSNNGTQSVVTVSFKNSPNGGLLIRKIDAKTKLPMAGVEFLVTDSKGAFIGTGNGKFITGADGGILIGDVTPGTTLVVRETRTLPGYILDTTPQTCVVQEGRTTTLEFHNEPDGIIIIYKKDAVTGAALRGVQFTVTNGNGELVAIADGMISSNGVYYTDENGRIVLDGLKPDTYVVTETATISGYVLDKTPHTIAVKANDTQTLTITNRPRGGLIIMKLSRQTRQPLAGAEFRIVPADATLLLDNEGLTSPNNLYVTDADGQISLSNLTPGAYIITETNAPDGYSLDSEAQTVTVRSGRTDTISFYDSELAVLKILKRDAVSKQPLADAEFTVTTADGTRLGENNGLYITDDNGTVTVTGLQPNSAVIVAETSSPAGYVMNATPKNIIVRSGTVNSLVFDDEPKTTLIVHKYVSGTRNEPLSGVEFKVTDSKGEVQGMNNGVYYTDASGDFMVTGLDPGLTVTVRETKTVDGFVLDGTPQDILIKAGERQELTFWNQRKGTLIVRKLDSVTGNPISGAEFHIAYANGNPVDAHNGRISSNGRYVTDSRGEITLTDVTGTIVITETKAVDGYYIDPANRTQTVIVNPEDAQTITFFNTPTQTLTLQKYVTDTTTPIQGVSFHITDSAGNAVGNASGDFVTDRNGQIVLTGLIPGTTITARESAVPEDYVLDATPHSILIRTGEAQQLTVYNQLKANLIVQKIDSATGNPLSGAQFKITTADGATVNDGVFTTDRAGQITLNKLTPGAYVLTETKAPEGYVLNPQPQTILLSAGETKTVTVGNAVKGSLIIAKFDSLTRRPLAGAEFKVMTAEGTLVAANGGRTSSNGLYTTDANGQITLSGLEPGSYVVTERKAPDNYYLNVNSQTVVVTADDVQTLSFYDEPFASLTILKRDSVTKAPLSGAEFSVKDVSGELIANCVTGADGTATVSGLTPNATLVITEISAPAGYVLSETPQTIRVRSDAPNSVTFEDAPTGTLVIRKFIAGTANEPLSGVAFKVMYGNGKNVGPDDGVYYTDSAGEITLTGLTPGATVKAREIQTVNGFALDGTPQDIEILPGQTQQLTFWNTRKGSLLIKKLDKVTGNPLSGVMFRITTATGEYVPNNDGRTSGNGFFTTDRAGEILLTGVTGTLVVTEFSTISGYVIDEATRSQTVVVNADDTQTLVFYNEPMTTLTVQKYVTGTTTPLEGAGFFVCDSRGLPLGNSNGMFVTDENGRFVISDLAPGLSVTVKETEAPDGYVLDSAPQTIRIRSGMSAQTLTFYNAPKGSVSVRKLDAVTEQPLSGAEFKVTSASGVPLDNDGGKISTNGVYRTDDNGQFLITKVQPGAYVITETKAPNGYILDATPLTITVSADDAQTITVKNRPKQTLTVQKFVSGTSTPLSGVEFLVTDNHGAVIGSDNGSYKTDDNGRFVISGLTPGQTITVKETKTLPGYILNDKPQSVAIEAGDAQTLTFYNEAKSAILIIKRDSVTEQPLSGAEFQVMTADGKFVDDMGGALSSNGIYVTDERGQILISGLNPGVLVVKETKAPNGYVLNDKPQAVELKASETQTLTFRNVPKQTVIIQKYVEGTTNPLPGVTFLITDGGGNRIGAGEYVTDANGRIEIPGVNPGTTVIAREVKTASGYALNGSPKSLEVKVGTLNALTFYDEPLSTLVIRKYIEGTANEPLPGVAFKVVDGNGANVGTDDGVFYTDSAGEIRIENLEAGTLIKAREIKTVDGFVLDGTPRDILMQSGVEQELVFWNKRQGTLTISKLDSVTRQPLSGVEFTVNYSDGRAIGNGRYFTDNRGEINITGINGSVVITEAAMIPGYVMDADSRTRTVTVNPMEGKTVTFTNTPMQTLTVRKYITGTTTPIPGAVFMVSDSSGATLGNNNGEFTTDSHGEITISGLIPGTTVTAREVRPASGYLLNGEAQTIKIKSGDAQTLTFYNTPLENLTIRKYAEGTTSPLSGVTFYVTDGAGTPVGSGEFVTDDNGRITIPGFAPGDTVIVREVKTVKGYALNGTPKTLKIASGQENALTFYDAPLSTLLVHKYVDGTANESLPGVTFKITDASGKSVGNADGIYTTDANGDITIPNLEAGTVIKAREVKTVGGYLLDGTPQDIEITKAAVNELTFWNVPAQTLIIEKRASDTDAPLQGVTFIVRDSGGAFIGNDNGEFTTDRNGQIVIRGLVPGVTITALETKTISGYVLDETPQNILIQKGDAQKLVFRNAPKGALTVRKLDAATNAPLSGAEFRILTVNGTPVDDNEGQTSTNGVYITDANGEIVIAKLQPGVYKVSESKAPEGYVLDTTPQTVTVNVNDTQTLTFRDVPKQTLTVQKYEKGTTTPISGAKFLVTDDNGAPLGENNGEFVTDDNGRFVLTGLVPGVTITAKEIEAPAGYVLDSTPKSVKIKSGAAQTLTFQNIPEQLLIIQKYVADTTTPIQGVTFHVTDTDGKAVGASNGNFVTDANGQIVISGLTPGMSVTAKETKAVSGYVLDSTPQTIKIQSGEAQSIVFYNSPKGSLTVIKRDIETDAPLSGAEFKVVTAKGEPVDQNEGQTSTNGVYVTDANGRFTIANIQPGAYIVTETKAPSGYALDNNSQTVTVNANDAQTLTFRDTPLQSVTIQKYIDGTTKPLSGVTFLVTDTNGNRIGNGEYITDANGQIVLSGLTPGMSLVVREVKTVKGYALNGAPQTIQVGTGNAGASLLTVPASANTSGNGLTFYDESLSTLVIHKFIKGTDNEPLSGVTFKVVDGSGKNVGNSDGVFFTDDSGDIVITGLERGTVIKAREIKTVDGYVLDGTPQDIQIQDSELHELTFWNAPKQSLTIQKYAANTTVPVKGAKFLVTDNGQPVGESDGEFTTDDNGQIVLTNLVPGVTVTAKEIEAPEGYVLDSTPKTIKIKSGAAQTLTFYNVKTQNLIIRKYVTDTTTPIQGVTFRVTDADGKGVGASNGNFVTDANGEIVIPGLAPGMSVTVKETKAASGYVLDSTPQTVKIKSGEAQSIVFYNSPKGSLTVSKRDSLTDAPLSGAEFKVVTAKGEPVDANEGRTSTNGIYVTDANGQFTITGLQPGAYVVSETKAPDGYVLDTTPQTVTVNANDAQTLTFRDVPKQTLTVQKYEKGTTTPIPGAKFLVTNDGEPVGENNGEFTTDDNGRFVLTGLVPGITISVKEIEAAEGYVLDSTPKTIKIKSGAAQSLTFYNVPLQSVVIQKYIDGTTKPLSGVTFLVTDTGGNRVGNGEYVTDDNGQIVISGLTSGMSLVVREVKTVKGYVLNGTPQTIQVGEGGANAVTLSAQSSGANATGNSLTFYDEPLSTLVVHKYVKGTDNEPLPGVTFKIVDGSGKNVGNSDGVFVTDDNGDITIPDLEPGTVVKVREVKTVDGYVLDGTPQDIEIRNSELHELTFWNSPKESLVIRIFVTDTTTPIPGTTFHIAYSDGKAIGDFVTDNNGEILISSLVPGVTVTAKETKTVSGYILDSTPQSVKIKSGEARTVTFYNSPKGSLSVMKLDSLTERPLSGAEFRVTTAKGEFVDANEGQTSTNGVYRTDESGRFTISNIAPGSYVVTEIKAPSGYVLDSEPQTVTVNANDAQTLTFRDAPTQTLIVEIFVTDTTTPIPGTTFIVMGQDGKPIGEANGEFIADENGRITIPGLTPGVSVTVKQTKAVNGYLPDGTPKTILIKSGDAQTLRFYNSPAQTLTIRKFVSGTTTPLQGVTFHITDSDGKVIGNENGDFVTDKDGQIVISGLIPGTSVTAKETKTVSGYVLDTTPQTIAIRSGDAQSLTFFNAPKGALVLRAVDSVTEETLPDVEFKIVSANGEPLDSNEGKTSSNGIYTTDSNGTITITKVQPGIYHIVETKVPDGYVLNEEAQTVTVNADDTQTIVFRNVPKQTLTVQVYEEGTTKPIPGIAFLLKDSSGAFIGTENGEFITDANGQITVSGLTPGVTVVANEIRTVTGYVLNNVPQNIKIQTGDAQKLTFFNIPLESLTIWKFQKGTTTPLQGVAFLVVDGDGKPLNGGEYVTDENGRIVIDGLEPGMTVTAREIRTVKGYQLNGNPQNITIASGKDNALTFYDDPLSTLIVRLFIDGTENEPISGAAFKVVDGSGKALDPDDGVYYTDHAGMFTLENLEPGVTVKARLIKIADEFVLDGTPQGILMESGDVQSLTFWAKRAGSLTIRSLDSVTRQPIPNVEFKVTYADGRAVDTANGQVSSAGRYFTDANGEIRITGVVGTLIVTEEKTSGNYTMGSANRSQTVVVRPADGQTLTFFDAPAQGLTVQLYVKGTTTPIPGAKFLLTDGTGAKLGNENGEFTTDDNGRFSLSGLKPGLTVKVKQISTTDAYILDGTPRTVTMKTDAEQTVTVYNAPKQTLTVRLYVKGTTTPIPGAKFLVRDSGGSLVGENNGVFVTNDNGGFTITGLAPGVTITATQTDTVSGYVLETTPQSILIKSGNAQSLTFYNAPKGALVVKKLDAVTENPLAGAEFKILTISGTPVDDNEGKTSTKGIYRTDDNGEITLLKLEPGVYTVTETKAPSGYVLDSEPQTVTVNADDCQTLTFRNNPLQSLTIRKYEDGTTKPLAGVTFTVTDTNGNRVGNGEYVTDANGEITITGLVPGMTVIVRETRTVKGYVLNGNPQTITIGNGANTLTSGASAGNSTATGNALTFYDEPLSTLVIHKYVEGTDNEPLANVEFQITDGRGAKVGKGTYYTDKSGEIRVENLEPGMTVTVRETKTVSGYVLDGTPKTAEIPSGDVLELVFWNAPRQTLTIRKFIEGTTTPIKGVTFMVTDRTGAPVGDADGEFVTDENGEIVIDGLTPGDVITARETKAASGYVLDGQPKSVTIKSGAAQTLRFYNSPQGSLIIEKRDKLTQKPLSGAKFQIMSAGGGFVDNIGGRLSSNGQYTTDSNGQIILSGLNPDTLVVKEIAAPSGYELDAAPQTVKVNANDTQTLTFYDTPQQTLTILKLAEGTNAPLQGVTFLVTAGDGSVVGPNNGLYTTDANGLISISGLTPGVNVTVRESKTVSGYQLDTAPQSIQIKSGEAQRLTFYNKPVEPLGGLLIKKMDAATKEPLSGVAFKVTRADGSVVGVTNGEFVTDGSGLISIRDLEPDTYVVREIRAKDGYLLDDTAKTIEIKDKQTYTLEFYNAAKGGLIIHKLDSVTKEPLSGVQFKIAYADGSYVNRGNLSSNGLYFTDKEGQIVISGVTGTVVITEMQTIDGYKIDPATRTQTVEIKANETQSVTVYNEPVGGVEIIKVNEDDRTIRIPNVTFEIRKTEGGLVKTVTTGQNGRVYAPLDAGSYYALEIETAKGYRLDATPQYFDVEDGKTTTLTVRNKAFSGILIHKTDSVTGKGIYGVSFLLYDANKNPIRQYESDQNGYVYIDNLPASGRYYVREMENPGYVPDMQLKTVYVEVGGTIEIEWKNQPLTGQIQVYKYAAEDNAVTGTAAGAPLQGAVYEIVNVRSGQGRYHFVVGIF